MTERTATMEKIISLCKRRGFVFPGSEIYGGLAGTWDYGPLGVELKNNIKKEFWRSMVYQRTDTVGLDAAILMNPKVWEASGHTAAFADPLVECKICHERFRADHQDEIEAHHELHKKKGEQPEFTEPRQFNLLVEAGLGSVEGEKMKVYLRGEITQGAHANFKNVLDSSWCKIPFGIVQIGKAFRNEITPGNFLFRSREFEQMELQYYVKPDEKESLRWFDYWKEERAKWYRELGISEDRLRFREHAPDERAHYARAAWDIEIDSPLGWKEVEGIHHRGDWDLSRHSTYSGVDISYYDEETKERYIPWVIETSGGIDRAFLFFIADAYREEPDKDGVRTFLKLNPKLASYKAAVFPLLANKPELIDRARKIYETLRGSFMVAWDDIGNIGKRYRRQDEIGTPFCVTIDYETLEDGTVTVRDRDSMQQERIKDAELAEYLREKLS